jgi:oligopeptide transport system substrate-binding protein
MRRFPFSRRPPLPLFFTLLTLTFAVTGFPLPAAAAPKILNYGNGAEPQDLDPQIITGVPEHHIIDALFEGLVSPSPDGDDIAPGVAKSWDISDDGLTYTFHLREDARWSNGDPVTAQDFVGSYRRMLTRALAANYAYMLYLVAGAEDYHAGKITDFAQTGFHAPDAHTLTITLRQRATFFLKSLVHPAWFPVPLATLEKFGALTRQGTRWTRPENIVGNGAFVLTDWRPAQKIVVSRSPTYWDRDRVKLDEIHFFPIEVPEVEEAMFRTGQLHITYEIPRSKIATYERDQPDVLKITPYCGIYYYRFNTAKKPFDDVRVRRALALSINREALVKFVTRGGEIPAYNFVPPDVSGFKSEHHFKTDIAEARRLLAEAGYPDGKGLPKIELLFNTDPKHRLIGEALQQMWRKNLNVGISLYNQEWRVYLDAQKSGNFQFQRAGWIADYVDPNVFLDLWQTRGGNNNTNWGSPEYDRLLSAALDAENETDRYAIYQRMEKILIDKMPVLPIYFYTNPHLVSPKILHFRSTYLNTYPWKYIDLAE